MKTHHVIKHANGFWQAHHGGRLLCGAFFKRRRDAEALSRQHAKKAFDSEAECFKAAREQGGFFA